MVYAKVQLFEKGFQEKADLFKALSHPARLSILKYLAEKRLCMTGDITEELPLSRTTVNQHLSELKRVGLIQGSIEGSRTNYCLDLEKMRELKCILSSIIDDMNIEGIGKC